MDRGKDISIIFLTYNGLSDHFKETLKSVLKQKTSYSYEIIVIDSGSIDGTIDFVKKFPEIKLIQIPNSKFSHGGTRQLGVIKSSGKYLIYLSQDATPADDFWLEELIKKLTEDNEVVAVSSRIIPRSEVSTLRKYNVLSDWCASQNDFKLKIENPKNFEKIPPEDIRYYTKIHDVSSAYKRFFLENFGFDRVFFGEDTLIAKKALKNGFAIGFASKSIVRHSHKYRIVDAFKRNLTDAQFNFFYLSRNTSDSLIKLFIGAYRTVKRDYYLLLKDSSISLFDKIGNIFLSPIIHFAEQFGQYAGMRKCKKDRKNRKKFDSIKNVVAETKDNRKNKSKIKYLFLSALGLYKKEGLSKLSRRILNYLLHDKGVLKYDPEYFKKEKELSFIKIIRKFELEMLSHKIPVSKKENILYFDHELGGGTDVYRERYIKKALKEKKQIMVVTYSEPKKYFRFWFYKDKQVFLYKFGNLLELFELFKFINPGKIIVGGLVSYPEPLIALEKILEIKNFTGASLRVLIHDYFCVCPNYNLIDHTGDYCGIPEYDYCDVCMKNNKDNFEPTSKKRDIRDWRASWYNFLSKADEIICFSHSSKKIIEKAYEDLVKGKIKIIPHKVDYVRPIGKRNFEKGHIFTIGIMGSVNFNKGSKIIEQMISIIEKKEINVKIVAIGIVKTAIRSHKLNILGRYKRDDIVKLTIENEIDVFFLPSICPETFSYTAEEAMQMGMPLAVFDIGAPAERVRNYKKGLIIQRINAELALKLILKKFKK